MNALFARPRTKSVWFTPTVKKVIQGCIHMLVRLIVQTVHSSCTRESVTNNPKHVKRTERLSLKCIIFYPSTHLLFTALAAPKFTVEPSDVAVDIGFNVTLRCYAQGYPEPEIAWRREDGSPLFNRPRTHGTISQSKGHLQITSKIF